MTNEQFLAELNSLNAEAQIEATKEVDKLFAGKNIKFDSSKLKAIVIEDVTPDWMFD